MPADLSEKPSYASSFGTDGSIDMTSLLRADIDGSIMELDAPLTLPLRTRERHGAGHD
jgi:hypothetical protein